MTADEIGQMLRTASADTEPLRERIAELEALVRDLSANYRAACAQLQGESGDAEFWGEDAKLLARCDALIGKG